MKFSITKNNNNTITVNGFVNKDPTKKEMGTLNDVLRHLQTEKVKVGKCLKNDEMSNRGGKTSGMWIFEVETPKKINKKTTQVKKRKTTLDSATKNVVQSDQDSDIISTIKE
mgnify:CR=1 FL=1|tara:strand:- start:2694 stop:3029 length:336 start_codon:yes stop_codon:yes gene_type:complete